MGYLFLSVSLFAGVTKGFCGKKAGTLTESLRGAVGVNAIRMLLCVFIGFFFVLFDGGIPSLAADGHLLLHALSAGVSTSVFAVTWLLSVRRGAYMLVDVSLMCSVLVPVLGSFFFLGEPITWQDYISMALLVAAVVCMCIYNNRIKSKLTCSAVLLLIVCGMASGLTDFTQKLYVGGGGEAVAAFNFYTYIFAAVTLSVFLLFMLKTPRTGTEPLPLRRVLPFIVIMALCMFAASYFQTLAARYLPAATLYPLARGIALLLSLLMSRLCFGERLTAGSLCGMGLALAAVVIVNL